MRIVVTSTGRTLDDQVDVRFGRAKYFLFFDTESEELRVKENTQNLEAMQGAGIQAAGQVVELKPEYIITGHCGPKAFTVLQAAGVKVVLSPGGTCREAIEQLGRGELRTVGEADVEGHWV